MATSTVLVVVAHPDDECFMGGTIASLTSQGRMVWVAALADGETSRRAAGWKQVEVRHERHIEACKTLGAHCLTGQKKLADQRLDMVPLLDITRQIEEWIAYTEADTVFTHSDGDANADHRRVYDAALPACRPKNGVRNVYAFAGPSMRRFCPNVFWDISGSVAVAVEAVRCYGEELAPDIALLGARAVANGHAVGVSYAEAFEVFRELR